MENISLAISSMSTVLPVWMEKIFNLIQVTNSTYPLFIVYTLVDDSSVPVLGFILSSGKYNDDWDKIFAFEELSKGQSR